MERGVGGWDFDIRETRAKLWTDSTRRLVEGCYTAGTRSTSTSQSVSQSVRQSDRQSDRYELSGVAGIQSRLDKY